MCSWPDPKQSSIEFNLFSCRLRSAGPVAKSKLPSNNAHINRIAQLQENEEKEE